MRNAWKEKKNQKGTEEKKKRKIKRGSGIETEIGTGREIKTVIEIANLMKTIEVIGADEIETETEKGTIEGKKQIVLMIFQAVRNFISYNNLFSGRDIEEMKGTEESKRIGKMI